MVFFSVMNEVILLALFIPQFVWSWSHKHQDLKYAEWTIFMLYSQVAKPFSINFIYTNSILIFRMYLDSKSSLLGKIQTILNDYLFSLEALYLDPTLILLFPLYKFSCWNFDNPTLEDLSDTLLRVNLNMLTLPPIFYQNKYFEFRFLNNQKI